VLQQQLKSATISSKGGDKAKQMAQKELEKCQKKLAETEGKYRNAVADKGQVRGACAPVDTRSRAAALLQLLLQAGWRGHVGKKPCLQVAAAMALVALMGCSPQQAQRVDINWAACRSRARRRRSSARSSSSRARLARRAARARSVTALRTRSSPRPRRCDSCAVVHPVRRWDRKACQRRAEAARGDRGGALALLSKDENLVDWRLAVLICTPASIHCLCLRSVCCTG
jgi:hypothetical protein